MTLGSYPTNNLSNIKCCVPFWSNENDISFSLDDRCHYRDSQVGSLAYHLLQSVYALIVTIVGKSADLELLVLRDNWLVTSRKLNLQLGDNFLLIMKAMSHRAMLNNETTSR